VRKAREINPPALGATQARKSRIRAKMVDYGSMPCAAKERKFMKNPRSNGKNNRQNLRKPQPACPGCGMVKNDWPGEGYTYEGQSYCCQGCAEGTGCTCVTVPTRGYSPEGQVATKAKPRPGRQRSGARAPQGELSGQRDDRGTEEAIDQSGYSTVLEKVK
jgi:hypothetical protein